MAELSALLCDDMPKDSGLLKKLFFGKRLVFFTTLILNNSPRNIARKNRNCSASMEWMKAWAAKQGSGFAVDELTGLIGAAAIMRPSKSVSDLELKSVKKKYKNPNFAAGCSREVIERGAEMLGWTLDDLISETIFAMRASDDVG